MFDALEVVSNRSQAHFESGTAFDASLGLRGQVKSLVKFFWHSRPLPFADVLMDLVRVDFSGANFLAIIEQRYESLRVLREEERLAARRAQLLLEEKERLEREAREEFSLKKVVPDLPRLPLGSAIGTKTGVFIARDFNS